MKEESTICDGGESRRVTDHPIKTERREKEGDEKGSDGLMEEKQIILISSHTIFNLYRTAKLSCCMQKKI